MLFVSSPDVLLADAGDSGEGIDRTAALRRGGLAATPRCTGGCGKHGQ